MSAWGASAATSFRSAALQVCWRPFCFVRVLLALRAVLVPSLCYEVFPLIPAEALSHGTPVIARRIGATRGGFVTADGERHDYRVCGIVQVEVQGRRTEVSVVELPRGARPLLGAIPLEAMDWHVHPGTERLLPNPDSPDEELLPMYGVHAA